METSIFGNEITAADNATAKKTENKTIQNKNKAKRIIKRQQTMKHQNKKYFGNGGKNNNIGNKVNGITIHRKNKNRPHHVKGMKLGRRLLSRGQFSRKNNIQVVNTPKRIHIAIDLQDVNKNDLIIQVSDKVHRVTVSGKYESNLEINSKFSHIVPLPKKVIMSQVTASVSKNGFLIITAPKEAKADHNSIGIECSDVNTEPFDNVEMMAELKKKRNN